MKPIKVYKIWASIMATLFATILNVYAFNTKSVELFMFVTVILLVVVSIQGVNQINK